MIQPNFSITSTKVNDRVYDFVLSPLPQGFGNTLGSVFRRTLLSSNEGVAVSYIRIKGVSHPFTTLDGVKESVLQIIMNIKSICFAASGSGPWEVHIKEKGLKKIVASVFNNGVVKVADPSAYVAEITDSKTTLEIDLILEKGVGYIQAEEKEKKEEGFLAVDSLFSPVLHVSYKVEQTRVGRKSDFDKLLMQVTTNGTVDPETVMRESSKILADFFSYIAQGKDKEKVKEDEGREEIKRKMIDLKVYQTIIDELDLPTRVINALLKEKIETVEDLVKKDKEELVKLKGVGKKSLNLIEKELEKLGVSFEHNDET